MNKDGNPDIAGEGKTFAKSRRDASRAKIAEAQARIKERILCARQPGAEKVTIAAVLKEAGLNRLYLEGKNRRRDKQEMKDWLALAARRFKATEEEVPPSRKLEDRFDVLKLDFLKLQHAYVAAHRTYQDQLAEANDRIGKLEAENAALRGSPQR